MPESKPKSGALFGRLTLAELRITSVALHGLTTPPTVVEKVISKHTSYFCVCRMYFFVLATNTAVVPEAWCLRNMTMSMWKPLFAGEPLSTCKTLFMTLWQDISSTQVSSAMFLMRHWPTPSNIHCTFGTGARKQNYVQNTMIRLSFFHDCVYQAGICRHCRSSHHDKHNKVC